MQELFSKALYQQSKILELKHALLELPARPKLSAGWIAIFQGLPDRFLSRNVIHALRSDCAAACSLISQR